MQKIFHLLVFTAILLAGIVPVRAQDGGSKESEKAGDGQRVRFNGLGRAYLLNTEIDGNVLDGDTATTREITDGSFLLDLKINATPNDKTEVQAILRLRNEFGGFFGAGQTVEVRELWARGIIADRLKYRVGDMDLAMTEYTFFLPPEEGSANLAAAFLPQQDVNYYENFYTDQNTRRIQGGQLDFGLNFTDVLDEADFSGFFARTRGTDFFTTPSRYVTGGHTKFSTKTLIDTIGLRGDFGFNIVHTFDDLKSGDANSGIRNTVWSADYDFTVFERPRYAIHIQGEAGRSDLISKTDSSTLYESDDWFTDIGIGLDLKPQKLKLVLSYVNIGPDFFSMGAQSRRVDYQAEKTYYDRVGNDAGVRQTSLFDITRDPAVYTFRMSDRLMNYDPRYSNTLPYGRATANRQGLRFTAQYGKNTDVINADLAVHALGEIRGQGTAELKRFILIRPSANLNIHQLLDWKKTLRFTVGYQFEQTTRDGVEVEQVDLTSNLIDLGMEAELFPRFEILAGFKYLNSKGSDYIPQIVQFNIVRDLPSRSTYDDQETLLAAGVKYQFKKGVYLTLQYQAYNFERSGDGLPDYGLNQIFALYTMYF